MKNSHHTGKSIKKDVENKKVFFTFYSLILNNKKMVTIIWIVQGVQQLFKGIFQKISSQRIRHIYFKKHLFIRIIHSQIVTFSFQLFFTI